MAGEVQKDYPYGPDFFVWTIPRDFLVSARHDIKSPDISALGVKWWLILKPRNGFPDFQYRKLELAKDLFSPPRDVTYIFGILGRGGDRLLVCKGEKRFAASDNCVSYHQRFFRAWLDKDLCTPDGMVSVFLLLRQKGVPYQTERPYVKENILECKRCIARRHYLLWVFVICFVFFCFLSFQDMLFKDMKKTRHEISHIVAGKDMITQEREKHFGKSENKKDLKYNEKTSDDLADIKHGKDMITQEKEKHFGKSENIKDLKDEKTSNNLADIKHGVVSKAAEENFEKTETRSHYGQETSNKLEDTCILWCFVLFILLSCILNIQDLTSKAMKGNFKNLEVLQDGEDTSENVPGKDVATDTAADFMNSEDGSLEGQDTSNSLSSKDVATDTAEDFKNSGDGSPEGPDTSNSLLSTLQTSIFQMYDTKEYTDVRFVVNGRIFEAHRLVLAARSPEFRKLLNGANAEYDTHIVNAENVTEAAFDILLRFLYKDTLETTDKKSIIEAYRCALTYRVQDLQDKCERKMSTWDITPDEVCTLLDSGLDVPTLRNRCMDRLRSEGAAILSTPSFLRICIRTLHFILESGALENVPTLQRIERILEWCVHSNPKEADYADARNTLLGDGTNPLLGRLKLQNLELQELSQVTIRYRGLITPEELVSFLRYRYTLDASVLPAWCLPVSSNVS